MAELVWVPVADGGFARQLRERAAKIARIDGCPQHRREDQAGVNPRVASRDSLRVLPFKMLLQHLDDELRHVESPTGSQGLGLADHELVVLSLQRLGDAESL